MNKGRSVRLYLADGSATGILTAEIMNWTGHAVCAPRTRFEDAIKRDELKRTGVYILIGGPSNDDLPSVYIGEGDDISVRLKTHATDPTKDFWDKFIAFTSKDLNLTKAHVKYLEARLIEMVTAAKKCRVENKTAPNFDRLPEADISDMETYLDEIQLILPVVGINLFRKPLGKNKEKPQQKRTTFTTRNPNKGIDARACEIDGVFVLLKGSLGSLNERVSFKGGRKVARDRAMTSKVIEPYGNQQFRVLEDIEFSSPSAAAVFLYGTSRNGRTDWKLDGENITYGEWQNSKI